MKTNQMKIEKIIDPSVDPVGAAAQTSQDWVSCATGPWIVTGTGDIAAAQAFCAEFRGSTPTE